MGPPPSTIPPQVPALTARLRQLLAAWCGQLPRGESGLEFSRADLAGLARAQLERRRQLAAQVKQARQALARAQGLGALAKVRRHCARQLEERVERLAQARWDMELLERAARAYDLLLEQAPAWLRTPRQAIPPLREPLAQAQEARARARRARERCRRLAGLARRLERRRVALAAESQALAAQALQLRPVIAAQAQRLDQLRRRPEPLPPHLGAPPELARLQKELDHTRGRAAAMALGWNQLGECQVREQDRPAKVLSAWQAAREQAAGHEQALALARQQVLAGALARGRAAVAAAQAARELEEMLGPLRPRELAAQIADCREQASAWAGQAALAREILASLENAGSQAYAMPAPAQAEPAAPPAGPPPELARLDELCRLARELYQQRVARELDNERLACRRQVRTVSRRLEQAARSRQRLRRKLAQRQEQTRRTLSEIGRTRLRAREWQEELELAQAEAERWRRVAWGLRRENSLAQQAGEAQRRALQDEAEALQVQAQELERQLRSLALLTAVATRPAEPTPRKLELALLRLAAARHHLAHRGKAVAAHAALVLGLGAALVLASPSLPAKATLLDHTRAMATLQLRAEVLAQAPAAELEVRLVPLDQPLMPLDLLEDSQFTSLAAKAGMSPYALYRSARAAHPHSSALELGGLERLAEQSRALARRHPAIFADLAGRSLPSGFSALTRLAPAAQPALHRFTDRLYADYRRLGYGGGRALAAVVTNQQAARLWLTGNRLPSRYLGRVRPVPAVEEMGLAKFLDRLSPYIAERSRRYLILLGKRPPANLERYARDLAFDMYGAAKHFQVPLSYLLAIAHQETFYANVLGDDDLSASPFQIWRPTLPHILRSMAAAGFAPPPANIRLQNHLTLATYLAAFHLRELMMDAVAPATKRHEAYVDMDKVMLRYNGSRLYAGRVAVRRAELDRFVALGGS